MSGANTDRPGLRTRAKVRDRGLGLRLKLYAASVCDNSTAEARRYMNLPYLYVRTHDVTMDGFLVSNRRIRELSNRYGRQAVPSAWNSLPDPVRSPNATEAKDGTSAPSALG